MRSTGMEWAPSLEDRIVVLAYALTSYRKEHLGNDQKGQQKSWTFGPWHFFVLFTFPGVPPRRVRQKLPKVVRNENKPTTATTTTTITTRNKLDQSNCMMDDSRTNRGREGPV
jgi:hypothetical protein